MLGIFEDERRENGRISPYPPGTGRIWARIARGDMGGAPPDRLSGGRPRGPWGEGLWWSAPRRLRLLALGQSRSRQARNLMVNRA